MTSQLNKYAVVSPVFMDYYSIGIPELVPEPTCEYIEVEARNKRAAKVIAVRQWRTQGIYQKLYTYCAADENPFVGLIAEALE